MIQLKNGEQIQKIKDSCRILAEVFQVLQSLVKPGITTGDLDASAREQIRRAGGTPAFLGYMGYPAALCTSVNEEVIHGIPSDRVLEEGDVISLDLGINYLGYFSDRAVTLAVGTAAPEVERLLRITEECLFRGIEAAKSGNRISDISRAVYRHAEANGYGVVHQYCGHGVGFSPHEDPQVPNYPSRGPNPRLKPGMVLAIEPMINMGTGDVDVLEDEWTVVTLDGRRSAHFEHTIAILPDRTEILTVL